MRNRKKKKRNIGLRKLLIFGIPRKELIHFIKKYDSIYTNQDLSFYSIAQLQDIAIKLDSIDNSMEEASHN